MVKLMELLTLTENKWSRDTLKKYINPEIAKILKKLRIPQVKLPKGNYLGGDAIDMSQAFWKSGNVSKKFEFAVGMSPGKGFLQIYHRDTNSKNWKKEWKKVQKPTIKIYDALLKAGFDRNKMELYADNGQLHYKELVYDTKWFKSQGIENW